jgi:hypothetical protein
LEDLLSLETRFWKRNRTVTIIGVFSVGVPQDAGRAIAFYVWRPNE